MTQSQWTEPRLFDPGPACIPHIKCRIDVNLDGPAGNAVTHVTISDLTTGARMAYWSTSSVSLDSLPASATEILADAVRTCLRDLSPF